MKIAVQQNVSRRRGTSVVEFAAVLPLVLLLLLGAIELGRAVMVQHELQGAAQAGCRVYSVSDGTTQDVIDIIDAALAGAGISQYEITYDPPTKSEVDSRLEPVTITVSVDFADVAFFSPDFLSGSTISGSSTMPADVEN